MRITCPNCNAQYEIAPTMVPMDGRDVQCSNCGTTWYQEGRVREAEMAGGEAPPPAADAPIPRRRPMADQKTLDILREERAHEETRRAGEDRVRPAPSARKADDEDPREVAAQEAARMAAAASVARARPAAAEAAQPRRDAMAEAIAQALRDGEIDDQDDEAAPDAVEDDASPKRSTRRDLLPDIEEINSSLRPDDRAAEAAAAAWTEGDPAADGEGFRIGFLAVCAVAISAVLLYAFADRIGTMMPALDGALDTYVEAVDQGRLGLEAGAESLLQVIGPDA
ncbi:MAG: zinc-ribbon domain-containing protein [Pseudomonadota bacterium]